MNKLQISGSLKEDNMSDVMKGMLLMLMILYVISPLDGCPGPIDDVIVVMLGMAARNRIDEA